MPKPTTDPLVSAMNDLIVTVAERAYRQGWLDSADYLHKRLSVDGLKEGDKRAHAHGDGYRKEVPA